MNIDQTRNLPAKCILLLILTLSASHAGRASESDPWTYAYIGLADSAALVNERLEIALTAVIDAVNSAQPGELDDRAIEFAFFADFRERHIRDVTWGMFERCIGTNRCDDWPYFERIQMYPEESVYHAAGWRFIPSRFHLASIVEVCGVRMGADKLTHFFDDGFHYYNALRSKRKNLDPDDIRRLSMAFERSYMGTRMTGIVSRADVEANLSGVDFYGEIFGGDAPLIGRDLDGRLVLLRTPDICDYVTPLYDERVLTNDFVYSLVETERAESRAQALERIIAARNGHAAQMVRESGSLELERFRASVLARRIPMTHWQSDFPKVRLVTYGLGMAGQWIFDSDFRQASNIFGFNPLKPGRFDDRKAVRIKRVEVALSAD